MVKVDEKTLTRDFTKLQLVELDACVACGECLNWCPIQDATKDPSISPPAKIQKYRDFLRHIRGLKARITGNKEIDEEAFKKFQEAVYTCTTCGNCGEVCETGIHTQRLWWSFRKKLVDLGYKPPGNIPDLLKFTKENRNIYNQSLEQRYKIYFPPEVKLAEKAEIGYFDGCGLAFTAAPMPEGAVRLIHASGVQFTMLDAKDAWCCGYPLTATGQWEIEEELVRNDVEKLAAKGVKKLVVSCPCCVQQFRFVWPKYYGGRLPFEIEHVTQFLVKKIEEGKLKFTKSLNDVVTFHDPCQIARGLKGKPIHEEVRKFISYLPGVKFIEMERSRGNTRCCGAGGGIRMFRPDISMEMGKLMFQQVEKSGAQTLLMSCPACYAMYVHRRIPPPAGKEWKALRPKFRVNDLMQYASRLL